MNPNQAFSDMFAAMKVGDFVTARDLAQALAVSIAHGGSFPDLHSPEAVQCYVASVLRRTSAHGPEPLFTLICRYCDAGEGIATEEAAMDEGWSEIVPDLELVQANYSGLCPECRNEQ